MDSKLKKEKERDKGNRRRMGVAFGRLQDLLLIQITHGVKPATATLEYIHAENNRTPPSFSHKHLHSCTVTLGQIQGESCHCQNLSTAG